MNYEPTVIASLGPAIADLPDTICEWLCTQLNRLFEDIEWGDVQRDDGVVFYAFNGPVGIDGVCEAWALEPTDFGWAFLDMARNMGQVLAFGTTLSMAAAAGLRILEGSTGVFL